MADNQTAEQLFLENKKLVYFYLHRYLPNQAFDEDVQQVAFLGLWKACKYFKPEKGFKFSALAAKWIHCELVLHLRNEWKQSKCQTFTEFNIFEDEELNRKSKKRTIRIVRSSSMMN